MSDVIEVQGGYDEDGDMPVLNDAELDLYFRMHKKVNERSQEISKTYKNNILVEIEDVEEVHNKAVQCIRSARPYRDSIIMELVVSHHEGEAERFKSFEDFKCHNLTSPSPTTEVRITYKFSSSDSVSGDLEAYKVTISIRSRIADLTQFEKEAPPFISSAILSNIVTRTAKINVEYSDYVKARHFVAMFDEWVKGCDESPEVKFIVHLKRISHLISRFSHLLVIALLGFFVSNAIEVETVSGNEVLKFIVLYGSVFYVVSSLADLCFKKLEVSIDSYLSLSYLKINKGDAKIIKSFKNRNTRSIFWSVVGLLGGVSMAVASSAAYDLIKYFISVD
ncbi:MULTISPECIES: hypothetical protein [unclassified Cobetia]|uniref:hypothetical protein n=1 Tax=unclassified Cobetia TaxID=2609414 RepID=UPI0020BDCFEE|nr:MULTISPECIES: hypothetical protein [unclassified Cobetia]MCK8068748.1 hypothetical protein [Cobetia sp. 1CM21F]MDH2296640.1 hypothetical protein [Cobetia sp. 29-18-1]